jgi:GNAT superfamily N-acetyltransferase
MTSAAAQMQALVSLREAVGTDIPFITNSWLKTFADSDHARRIDRDTYFSEQTRRMMRLLARSTVIVAVDPSDAGNILGYVVAEKSLKRHGGVDLHWVYVRGAFRRLGVMGVLLNAVGARRGTTHYTHQTDKGRQVAREFGWLFNPYALEE